MGFDDPIVICCDIRAYAAFVQQFQVVVFYLCNAPHVAGMESILNHPHNAVVSTLIQRIRQREKLLFFQHLLKLCLLLLWRIPPNLLTQKSRPYRIPETGRHARANKREKGMLG